MHPPHESRQRYVRAALGVLALLVLALCLALAGSYQHLYRVEVLDGRIARLIRLHEERSVNAADAGAIRPWMTFDYVNHLFGLPPSYLQSTLGIDDTRYPHLTIGEYFEHEPAGEAASSLLKVQDAVRTYATQ